MQDLARTLKIGRINFSSMSDDETLEVIFASVHGGRNITIAHGNQHFVVEAESNPGFRRALDSYQYVQPDGMGVYLASKLLHPLQHFKTLQTGTDFYFKLLSFANERRLRVFFLGDIQSTLELLKQEIGLKYPGIVIAGCHQGFFSESDTGVITTIAESRPAILVVGMGVPRQELWVSSHAEAVNVPVIISVGAGLRFMAGAVTRAPYILRKSGFEWLFRLMKEPVRLWRRYIIGIPYFCYLIIMQKIREKK